MNGDERRSGGMAGAHAVVIGGSMAGLCAARVLSERFERVTLVEKDALTDSAEPRRSVPQGRQLHALLRRGEDILVRLFPDLLPWLLDHGAEEMEFGPEFHWFHFGAWKRQDPTGVKGVCVSRPFLEAAVRRRVLALGNLRTLDEHDALGLTTSADRRRVSGVRVRPRDGGEEQALEADLVVDASGRGSRTPAWLEAIGRSRPVEDDVKVRVGYATRLFRRPKHIHYPWKMLYVLGRSPESRRLGCIARIEGDRWISSVGGLLDDHPPSDPAGWMEFARGLAHPAIYDALRHAEPLEDPVTYKFPSHLRRRYERMRDFPDGLAVLGDSHCSFNPIYGQGMTTAAVGADVLAATIDAARGPVSAISRPFQKALARATDAPWMMSTGEDFRYPEVEGTRPRGDGFMQWYTARVHLAAAVDPVVMRVFFEAMNMLVPPTALMRPGFALRVLRASRAAGAAARAGGGLMDHNSRVGAGG